MHRLSRLSKAGIPRLCPARDVRNFELAGGTDTRTVSAPHMRIPTAYFFKFSARKPIVRCQASAASAARYPSLLFGFSKA